MDSIVHGTENDSVRASSNVSIPGEEKYRDMVIPMQKDEGLLMDYNEKGVNELTEDKINGLVFGKMA